MKIFNFEFYFFKAPAIDNELLLHDERFTLSTHYYNDFIRYQRIKKFEVVKLAGANITAKIKNKVRPLTEREAYKYFLNRAEHPNKYYEELITSFEKGFDFKFIPIVNAQNRINDGQHRACWLMHTYGLDYEMDVLKIYFLSAPLFSQETLFRVLCHLIPISKYRKILRIRCNEYLKKQKFDA